MRLTQRQLRSLLEAEVDKMRLPRGPNSRDDGDKDLTEEDDLTEGRLNEEIDPVYDTIGSWANRLSMLLGDIDDSLSAGGQVSSDVYEALDGVSKLVIEMNKYSKMKPKS